MTDSERLSRAQAAKKVALSGPKPKMELAFRCVDLDQCGVNMDSFEQMLEEAREISFDTFTAKVDWKPIAKEMGYATARGEKGLRLNQDRCVSFYTSRLDGDRVYYMVHSAIEFVFRDKPAPRQVRRLDAWH